MDEQNLGPHNYNNNTTVPAPTTHNNNTQTHRPPPPLPLKPGMNHPTPPSPVSGTAGLSPQIRLGRLPPHNVAALPAPISTTSPQQQQQQPPPAVPQPPQRARPALPVVVGGGGTVKLASAPQHSQDDGQINKSTSRIRSSTDVTALNNTHPTVGENVITQFQAVKQERTPGQRPQLVLPPNIGNNNNTHTATIPARRPAPPRPTSLQPLAIDTTHTTHTPLSASHDDSNNNNNNSNNTQPPLPSRHPMLLPTLTHAHTHTHTHTPTPTLTFPPTILATSPPVSPTPTPPSTPKRITPGVATHTHALTPAIATTSPTPPVPPSPTPPSTPKRLTPALTHALTHTPHSNDHTTTTTNTVAQPSLAFQDPTPTTSGSGGVTDGGSGGVSGGGVSGGGVSSGALSPQRKAPLSNRTGVDASLLNSPQRTTLNSMPRPMGPPPRRPSQPSTTTITDTPTTTTTTTHTRALSHGSAEDTAANLDLSLSTSTPTITPDQLQQHLQQSQTQLQHSQHSQPQHSQPQHSQPQHSQPQLLRSQHHSQQVTRSISASPLSREKAQTVVAQKHHTLHRTPVSKEDDRHTTIHTTHTTTTTHTPELSAPDDVKVLELYCLDVSGSMWKSNHRIKWFGKSRFSAAQDLILKPNQVLAGQTEIEVTERFTGLIKFDKDVYVVVPCAKHDEVQWRRMLDALAVMQPGKGTALYSAIRKCDEEIEAFFADRTDRPSWKVVLHLLTDARDNLSDPMSASQFEEYKIKRGDKIHHPFVYSFNNDFDMSKKISDMFGADGLVMVDNNNIEEAVQARDKMVFATLREHADEQRKQRALMGRSGRYVVTDLPPPDSSSSHIEGFSYTVGDLPDLLLTEKFLRKVAVVFKSETFLKEQGIFRISGNIEQVDSIVYEFLKGETYLESLGNPHEVAHAVKNALKRSQPLIPLANRNQLLEIFSVSAGNTARNTQYTQHTIHNIQHLAHNT
eukprot:TRINITY_DN1882_c0_g2_i3.p1 TRINITY_DN1882_c0_g2~~TRINITY_DN1882_c0_g2_i3.p1  ORF type:complete len:966 (-),score=293.72 TRINITY_DN1882_c0_g2_i3:129-3026(-)